MTAHIPQTEPQLDAPGAGLPFFQGLMARWIFFPRMMRGYDGAASLAAFTRETDTIAALCEAMDEDAFFTRVLVDPIQGLEDSSRYWSAAMVLEHLLLCMRPMTQIAETLARGQGMNIRISTAAVKPKGGRATPKAEWIRMFKDSAAECARHLSAIATAPHVAHPAADAPRLDHPFFGAIPARGWVWVMGGHQITHRRQLAQIASVVNG